MTFRKCCNYLKCFKYLDKVFRSFISLEISSLLNAFVFNVSRADFFPYMGVFFMITHIRLGLVKTRLQKVHRTRLTSKTGLF